jgi:hypothetical protein
MTTSQDVAGQGSFPDAQERAARQAGRVDPVVCAWRGKAAVLTLFVISAADYTLAAVVIDTITKGGSSPF